MQITTKTSPDTGCHRKHTHTTREKKTHGLYGNFGSQCRLFLPRTCNTPRHLTRAGTSVEQLTGQPAVQCRLLTTSLIYVSAQGDTFDRVL
ncbi:hypothetical protein BaRGS_00025489 [Batillaria attramentaria]|uniref:Uncharacterized protein n=1 Tax=Batillaria attramentaria TaxID=370345 RepID=A0ABD0K8B6_9CAEN